MIGLVGRAKDGWYTIMAFTPEMVRTVTLIETAEQAPWSFQFYPGSIQSQHGRYSVALNLGPIWLSQIS